MKHFFWLTSILTSSFFAGGCATHAPIRTAPKVDLNRFMGDWYVIGGVLTPFEKNAYNPVESYSLNEDGTIATTFRFNKGSFDGPEKEYHPKGFIRDSSSNAIWGMQFIWPIKADYRIVYLDPDYSQTIVGRNRRDFAWIMARSPTIPEDSYQEMVEILVAEGYPREKIRKAPQSATDPGANEASD